MARVGYLFLQWGFLENDLRVRRGDVSALKTRPDLQEAKRIRNLIAHGIIQATAYPEETAHLSCRSDDGIEVRVTLSELVAAIVALERARIEILKGS